MRKMNRKLKSITIDCYRFTHKCHDEPSISPVPAKQGSKRARKQAEKKEAKKLEQKNEGKEYSYNDLIRHLKEECPRHSYKCPHQCEVNSSSAPTFTKEGLRTHLLESCKN
mmetsp:Transcript_15746/g.24223  ORF Transcript_15746/g.24223 Transcript_15746/m.24223 type:complete len:111 (+) Transcript_15746:275-607(+)